MTDTVNTPVASEEAVVAAEAPSTKRRGPDRKTRRRRTVLIAIIIILLLSLCVIAGVIIRIVQPSAGEVADREEAGGIEWVRSIYGWGPGANETFVKPMRVEVASNGNIYVSDQDYPFIPEFSPEGNLVRFIGEGVNPALYRVSPIAEGDGQLFFGQTAQDRIRIFTLAGEDEASLEFPSPNDIEFSGEQLAVASSIGFVVFDADGEYLWEKGGERGEGLDTFDNVAGLAYGPDGTLYVCDAFNNRISAYNPEGDRLWIISTGAPSKGVDIRNPAEVFSRPTTSPADLAMPADCVVDGNGRLVVVDGLDFSISVFNADDGTFVRKYGVFGTKEGQLAYPTSIDYDEQRDWFVVADGGNRRVQILRIEDSAGGAGAALGAARRALSGPLRACIFPLLLLVLIVIVWLVVDRRRKRAARLGAASVAAPDDSSETAIDADVQAPDAAVESGSVPDSEQ